MLFSLQATTSNDLFVTLSHESILAAFTSTIPCYLIGIYTLIEDEKKVFKEFVFILIILSIALFGILLNLNIVDIKNTKLILFSIYGMLGISFIITFFIKHTIIELYENLKIQIIAEKSRQMSSGNTKTKNIKV